MGILPFFMRSLGSEFGFSRINRLLLITVWVPSGKPKQAFSSLWGDSQVYSYT